MATLFDDDESAPVATPASHAGRASIQMAYKAQLLIDKPVKSLEDDNPKRDAAAGRFASLDVDRLFRAAAAHDLEIIVRPLPAKGGAS